MAKVPELVIGPPVTDKNDGTVASTEVTEPLPVPAPIAARNAAALNALTVLSALN